MASWHSSIRIVGPAGFDPGTAQTPGSLRLAAVAPQLGIEFVIVGRVVRGQAGSTHRHPSSW